MYDYTCEVVRVVDGDTLHLDVDLGFHLHQEMTIRLAGINAPEMSTVVGKAVRSEVVKWVEDQETTGRTFRLHTMKDKKEKYGRYLGVLIRDGDELSLNNYLLQNGYAVEFMT